MRRYNGVRLFASLILLLSTLAVGLGSVSKAYAQDKGSGSTALPDFRQPDSARFDISGYVTSSTTGFEGAPEEPSTITITGFGALSGSDFEETITLNVPTAVSSGQMLGSAQSITVEAKVVQGKYYLKAGGFSGENSDQWYVLDSGIPGSTSALPDVKTLAGTDYTVTEEGKETINDVSTTKYKIDVDQSKLLGDQGGNSSTSSNSSVTTVLYLWIGDTDHYLYKYNVTLDMHSSFELDEKTKFEISISEEVTIALKDINTPITITAPENALPFEQLLGGATTSTGMPDSSSIANLASIVGMPTGMTTGMPAGMPIALPVAAPEPSTSEIPADMGMPKTGGSNPAPWGLLSLAIALITLGAGLKRIRKPVAVKA